MTSPRPSLTSAPLRRSAITQVLEVASPPELQQAATDGLGSVTAAADGRAQWLLDPIDVGRHPFGVQLVLRGPVGGSRSRVLWRRLLGDGVRFGGAERQPVPWVALEGTVVRSQRHPGRRTAQLLGIAAALQGSGASVLVVDSAEQRRAVEGAAARVWWNRLSQHLLRPPTWPTYDEATRRLAARTGATALVGDRAARVVAPTVQHVLVAKAPLPSFRQRTMRRLVPPTLADPFGEVVEPLAAHLVAELVALAPQAQTLIADPLLGTGLLAELLGDPKTLQVGELPSDDDVITDLVNDLLSGTPAVTAREGAVERATTRVLGPSVPLHDFQQAVIDDVMNAKDVLAVFRTGKGKSLCYQVPGIAFAGSDAVTLVISPLVALQHDQLDSLRRKGVMEAALYNSQLSPEVRAAVRRGIQAGFYRIVFLAPEALAGHAIRRTLAETDIALIAIDEAHCISEMGHYFRPDYRALPREIGRLLGLPGRSPLPPAGQRPILLALTGTANPQVIDDIKAMLS